MGRDEEEKDMSIPQEKLRIDDALKRELIKKASEMIDERYNEALKLISKN